MLRDVMSLQFGLINTCQYCQVLSSLTTLILNQNLLPSPAETAPLVLFSILHLSFPRHPHYLQDGPLLVINGVIIPINDLING